MPGEFSPWERVVRSLGNTLSRLVAARRRFAECGMFEQRSAHQRALDLLLECLTPAQRTEYERSRAFTVQSDSGRRYRINYGTMANIDVLAQTGEVTHRLCARPLDVPTPAVMLVQKLMLEKREDEFLRVAAKHAVVEAIHPAWRERVVLPGG